MKKIFMLLITVIVFFLSVLFIVSKKYYFSENENRYLQKKPEFLVNNVLDGKYFNNVDLYINDHFPFRNNFLSFKTYFLKFIGNNKISNIYLGKDNFLFEEFNKPSNDKSIVSIINKFSKNNNKADIQVMLVPTSTYIYKEKLPINSINYSQKKVIDSYKENLNTKFIDVSSILNDNKDKYIYYKTDHHWTLIGAYYAYLEYANYNNITPIKYNNFEKVNSNFYGTHYSKVLDNTLVKDSIYKIAIKDNINVTYDNKNKDNKIYYKNWLNKKDKYNYYLNGNHSSITINNTNQKNNNKLLIIKDSYANSFIPFLIPHYNEITIIDPRYYKNSISEFIKNNNYSNILFLYNISTIDDDIGIRSINRE